MNKTKVYVGSPNHVSMLQDRWLFSRWKNSSDFRFRLCSNIFGLQHTLLAVQDCYIIGRIIHFLAVIRLEGIPQRNRYSMRTKKHFLGAKLELKFTLLTLTEQLHLLPLVTHFINSLNQQIVYTKVKLGIISSYILITSNRMHGLPLGRKPHITYKKTRIQHDQNHNQLVSKTLGVLWG